MTLPTKFHVSRPSAGALEWPPYNVQVHAIAPGIFPDLSLLVRLALYVQQSALRRWSPWGDLANSEKWGFWPCIAPHRLRIV